MAFILPHLGWLLWFTLIPFFVVVWSADWRWSRLWRLCLAWALPYNLCGMFFLTQLHSLEWRGLSHAQSLIFAYGAAWIGGTLVVAPPVLAWGYALYRLRPTGVWRFVTPAALWVVMEWAQRHLPLAMPWNLLALSQIDYPALVQITAVTGALGVSALIVAVANAVALGIVSGAWPAAMMAVGVAVVNGVAGWAYLATRPVPVPGTGVAVQILQGNMRPDVNWQPSLFADMLTTYETMTRGAARHHPKLIVWPESALPVDVPHTAWLTQRLQDLARETGATLAIGTLETRPENGRLQNDLGFYDPNGLAIPWYHKRHLVPFGEYTPGGSVLKPVLLSMGLAAANTLPSDAMPGDSAAPISVAGMQLGPLICFETLFPNVVQESVAAGADVLIEVTNDAWFKQSSALAQHNGHAALRALENHRFIMRAANTGVSSIIDPYGRVVATMATNERGTVSGEVWPHRERTPASRWPDWWVAASVLVIAVGGWRGRQR